MRARDVAGMLVGAVVVFGACAVHVDDSGSRAAADSGTKDGALEAAIDALGDSLGVEISPIKDAEAGPGDPPTTKHSPACDKSYILGGVTFWYAEQLLAGRSKEDLARATALLCDPAATTPGYTCTSYTRFDVRDGAIAVQCGSGSGPRSTVTLIIPPPI